MDFRARFTTGRWPVMMVSSLQHAVQELLVLRRLTDPHVHHHLFDLRNLVRILEAELLRQRRMDVVPVVPKEPGLLLSAMGFGLILAFCLAFPSSLPSSGRSCYGLGIGFPLFTEIRSLVPSASTLNLVRLASPPVGSTNMTLEMWMGASNVMIPPSGLS